MGLREGRGRWVTYDFDTTSTATFRQGSLVNLNPARTVREYASTDSQALGIAQHNSTDSLPAGKVLVKVPASGDCTFWADVGTVSASSLSAGIVVGITKSGNTVSLIDYTVGSAFSRLGVLTGKYTLSPISQVEVAPNSNTWVVYGASTVTFAS